MFELEALRAKHGDCLLLHWGSMTEPRLALIDGGPNTTYFETLKPRLAALAQERGVERLVLDLTLVSHIDDDHINGLLDLAEEIENGDAPAEIRLLWHNSLEGLLNQPIGVRQVADVMASLAKSFPAMGDQWGQKVLSSVPQGQEMHAFAKRVGIADTINKPFDKLVLASVNAKTVDIKGLKLTIICPDVREVEGLRKKWVELRDKTIVAEYRDRSPYNLSSIVVLAGFGKKRMLLTGDARGDLIIAGLEKRKLLMGGKIHLDLLKLPHHGSRNNVDEDFFKQVTADVYVVSGDHAKFPNPHEIAMTWLKQARGNANYKILCTYELPYMREIFGEKLVVPSDNGPSVRANLLP